MVASGITRYPVICQIGDSLSARLARTANITLSAAASLPLTRDLALGGTYSTQRYGGSDGTTATQNISERKDYYTGSLTYSIPRTNSSISFVARNYRYVDDVVPSFNYNENRQDLNFTVRF